MCAACQKAVCPDCVGRDVPRLVCRSCAEQRPVLGYEYQSRMSIGGWPLVHICLGMDPVTFRPKVARGIVAIGNVAVGVVAIAGVACGLVTIAGVSVGVLFALGGVALGLGLSVGGLAVGSIAIGGLAIGLSYAMGATALGRATIDAHGCDPAAADFLRQWLGTKMLPPTCQ